MISAEEILARVQEIPPLPGTVLRLTVVINDPASTVEDIVEVIKYDHAVTSQMLRICNSAYMGLSRKIATLNDALRYLGTVKVLQLVMAVHANSLLSRAMSGYQLAPGILWRHSVAVALASAAFSQRVRTDGGNPNLAFTVGLLHDVGKVVLSEYVAREFAEIMRLLTERKTNFSEAEQQVLGFSHAAIGGMVAEKWQLPEPIVRCIRYHHEPSVLEPPDWLTDIVYLADCVCLMLGIGLGSDELHYRADPRVMERCGLYEPDLELVGAQMLVELRRVDEMFADAALTSHTKQPARTWEA